MSPPLQLDTLDAKAALRAILDGVAARHGIRPTEVNQAMGSVDDTLSDLVYEVRGELEREIEDLDPIC